MIQLSMIKKLYGINLDVELKSKLDTIAKNKFKSSSSIINELIFKYVKEHDIMGNKIQNNGTENLTKFF